MSRKGKSVETESRLAAARGRVEERLVDNKRYEVPIRCNENVLKLIVVLMHNSMTILKDRELCTLNSELYSI